MPQISQLLGQSWVWKSLVCKHYSRFISVLKEGKKAGKAKKLFWTWMFSQRVPQIESNFRWVTLSVIKIDKYYWILISILFSFERERKNIAFMFPKHFFPVVIVWNLKYFQMRFQHRCRCRCLPQFGYAWYIHSQFPQPNPEEPDSSSLCGMSTSI